jgi:DNA-binding PadR family transcriptional regulator
MMMAGPLARRVVSPLQFLVLLQLNEGPKYGYEMLKALQEEFDGVWEPKTGAFYPALRSLEARGFVEAEPRDETDFFKLTDRGKTLLGRMGERMESQYKFSDRYFRVAVKWMPGSIRDKFLGIIRALSEEDVDVYSTWLQFLDETVDRDRKLEVLEGMRKILTTRLSVVERIHTEITEGDST